MPRQLHHPRRGHRPQERSELVGIQLDVSHLTYLHQEGSETWRSAFSPTFQPGPGPTPHQTTDFGSRLCSGRPTYRCNGLCGLRQINGRDGGNVGGDFEFPYLCWDGAFGGEVRIIPPEKVWSVCLVCPGSRPPSTGNTNEELWVWTTISPILVSWISPSSKVSPTDGTWKSWKSRIEHNNWVVSRAHDRLQERGAIVATEQSFLTPQGELRKPDIVYKPSYAAFIVDVTVPFENGGSLTAAAR